MKAQNKPSDDRLKDLFREMPLENPSVNFAENIMLHVEKAAARQKRSKQWSLLGFIVSGVVGIVGIPAVIFYFLGIDWSMFDFSGYFISSFTSLSRLNNFSIDPAIIMLGIIILLLLISDTLIRKYIKGKKEKELQHA